MSLSIEVNVDNPTIELEYRREKDEITNRFVRYSYTYIELSKQDMIELLKFIHSQKPKSDNERSKFTLNPDHILYRNWLDNEEPEETFPNHLQFVAHQDRIVIETFNENNPVIPYYEVRQGPTPQDRNNLEVLENFVDQLLQFFENPKNSVDNEPSVGPSEFDIDLSDQFFDETLIHRSFKHFASGDYQEAIQQAFILLEERIRAKADLPQDMVGNNLCQTAFAPNNGPLATGETGGEQEGVRSLFQGAFLAFRNASHHRFLDEEHLDAERAYSLLCLINMLLTMTDEAAKNDQN